MKEIVARHLNQHKHLKIQLLNAKVSDYNEFSNNIKNQSSQIAKLNLKLKKSFIIIEDIISISKKDSDILRESLHLRAHHFLQKYFFISHSIYKTTLWSLIPYFNFIIVTKDKSSIPILQHIFITLKIAKDEVTKMLIHAKNLLVQFPEKSFFDCFYYNGDLGEWFFCNDFFSPPTQHIKLLPSQQSQPQGQKLMQLQQQPQHQQQQQQQQIISKSASAAADVDFVGKHGNTSSSSSVSNRNCLHESGSDCVITSDNSKDIKKALSTRFKKLILAFENKKKAEAIFNILIECIDIKHIDGNDLTFHFKTRGKKVIRISLIDYVILLVSKDTNQNVDLKMLTMHQYVTKCCSIPKFLIENKVFH